MQGKFITFEGIDGVGKTTQVKLLQKYLRSKGINMLVTREPGGTEIGRHIREILLRRELENMDSRTELLLMFAARVQHLKEVIYPALNEGAWVLCDRFTDSSYAYQGEGEGIPFEEIQKIEALTQEGFAPDLTVLLIGDIKIARQRVRERSGKKDRFESKPPEFFERVQQTYLKLADNDPRRFAVVEADQSIDEVATAIQRVVRERFSDFLA